MKLVLLALFATTAAFSATRVRSYVTKTGSYVQPYIRSNADSTKLNNYSTKGNVNPYTGQAGSK